MTINQLQIRNFQSLRRVDLELGTFTVIVGPSNSGKSALIRAFKALTSNVRGSSMVTRGQKAMSITARTDTHTVTLERSDRAGAYRISDAEGGHTTFTKLAGDVPDQVTQALRIDPVGEGGSVNFASQFDKPYLLDESGATVARVLGELTNVTTIFAAVRTANRIRHNAASTLKTRRADLEVVRTRLAQFQGLSDRVSALREAEGLDAERRRLSDRADRLETAILRSQRADDHVTHHAQVPDVPDTADLDAAMTRYLNLQAKLRGLVAKQQRFRSAASDATAHTDRCAVESASLAAALAEAGVCPTCNQTIQAADRLGSTA